MSEPTMTQTDCCEEFARTARVSRRTLFGAAAAAGAVFTTTSLFGDTLMEAAYGAKPGGKVLVVFSFRGGIDGLGVVVPHGDPALAAARPGIGVPTSQLIKTDGLFGLHPALAPLGPLWDEGIFGAAHAVGLPVANRSHFAAIEEIEDADPGSRARRGWVNRMAGLSGAPVPHDVIAFNNNPPALVEGPAPFVAASRLNDVSFPQAAGDGKWEVRRRAALDTQWAAAKGPLRKAYRSATSTSKLFSAMVAAKYTPAVSYPNGDLADTLKDAARLIKADLGVQVITIDYGGWDLHGNYGRFDGGTMASRLGTFAAAMKAFIDDLGDLARTRVGVLTISEFGRRTKQNANGGLDHGWGNVMLLLGAGVDGGKVHLKGAWPRLANTIDNDLTITTDYRQVLGEVVSKHLGKRPSAVFPGIPYAPIGVMR